MMDQGGDFAMLEEPMSLSHRHSYPEPDSGHNPKLCETTYLTWVDPGRTRVDSGCTDPPQDVGRHALTRAERDTASNSGISVI
ncbi:UNVERIFIED_CONTAM: hypothetical protein FKN15_024238 [Acipenser sinensis]